MLYTKVAARRVSDDQPVEVSRFEFVRVFRESLEVANAIVTRTRRKNVAERQRAQRGVTTRAAAADRHALAVYLSAGGQVFSAVDTVVDIDDAPLAAEPFAVGAPIARTAAIIDIENGKAPARPVLDAPVER